MKESVLKNILVNTRAFFTTNVKRRLNENLVRLDKLEDLVTNGQVMKYRSFYLHVLEYYTLHEAEARPYEKELEYLRNLNEFCNFPYKPSDEPKKVECGFDKQAKLPFVIHKGRKLFFKHSYSVDEAIKFYRNYMQVEKILGEGDEGEAPHQYQSPRVRVDDGDVVFDIGAAEGLFALDQIDKASRVVIVESDPQWMEPLKHTFAPFGDKVTIVQKLISATDTETTVSLEKLLSEIEYDAAFVKMDVEGYELLSLVSAKTALSQKNTKLAVAAYHKQHDAEELKAFFDRLNYKSEFSNGYMLFHLYDTPAPPYFRKGVIRAKHTES